MITDIPKSSWCCNKKDTLPTEGVENGQTVINMDNGVVKMFDAEEKEWKEI